MADVDVFKSHFGDKNSVVGYFATLAARGRPTLRPVTFFLAGRRLCFCTGAADDKIRQLKKNPHAEVCLPVKRGRSRGYYRLAGKAAPVTDRRTRKRILRYVPYPLENHWEGPDDPNLVVVVFSPQKSRYLEPNRLAEVDVKL